MTVYKSKVGYAILIPILLLLGLTYYLHIENRIWLGIIINTLAGTFIYYLYATTKYIVDGENLVVKAGFLFNETIFIPAIKTIARTRTPLSAPALSLDRIEIRYSTQRSVIISPRERMKLINHLKMINPNLQYLNNE